MDYILKAQYEIDHDTKIFDSAIRIGLERFVMEFNYYEYYPRKSNSKKNAMDIYA
jgi:hypothetical protein